jgi:hypothetical protein
MLEQGIKYDLFCIIREVIEREGEEMEKGEKGDLFGGCGHDVGGVDLLGLELDLCRVLKSLKELHVQPELHS